MTDALQYSPTPIRGAHVDKADDKWTLVLTRNLRHSPDKVWKALTDPDQLREWAPFDADRSLATAGASVKLTTVGAPTPHVVETKIHRAVAPRLLEFDWGGGNLRWELEASDGGTRMTLWANIDKRYISMGAAGWHVCFDVLDRMLDGHPLGRLVGPPVMKLAAWPKLHADYAKELGVEMPKWG